jgi:hypothetical protein
LRVTFLLATIDSWDYGDGLHPPDFFNVTLNGAVIYRDIPRAFQLLPPSMQLGFNPDFWDGAVAISLTAPHIAPRANIQFFANGTGWLGGFDDSWAIDDVRVFAESH